MSRLERLRIWFAHAFAVESSTNLTIDEAEQKLVDRVADFIVRRRLAAPALMILEVGRPLNFVGSQLLVFLNPFISILFNRQEFQRFTQLLEKRRSIDVIIEAIVLRDTTDRPTT